MTMKHLVILLSAALALATPAASEDRISPFVLAPPGGFVPDTDTAKKISEIILVRFFGEAQTDREKPLQVTLADGVWVIKGTMPPGILGGIAELHISKKDGQILFLSHGM
jgi:hypothetical protein